MYFEIRINKKYVARSIINFEWIACFNFKKIFTQSKYKSQLSMKKKYKNT